MRGQGAHSVEGVLHASSRDQQSVKPYEEAIFMDSKNQSTDRISVLDHLPEGQHGLAVELGVAEGGFSNQLVFSKRFNWVVGVDMYADDHDTEEYKLALRRVGLFENYKLLRMRFDEALDLFPDESIDFLYIDGYAHTGEDGGRTIIDWSRKVSVGGVIAGDDYDEAWPLVRRAVDYFVACTGFELHVTERTAEGVRYNEYPSWAVCKTSEVPDIEPDRQLEMISSLSRARVSIVRLLTRPIRSILRYSRNEDQTKT